MVRNVVGLGGERLARQRDVLGERALLCGRGVCQVAPHGDPFIDVGHSVTQRIDSTGEVPPEHAHLALSGHRLGYLGYLDSVAERSHRSHRLGHAARA